MTFNPIGVSLCARYAYAPNSLHYCGPPKQTDMYEYVSEQVADAGLPDILRKFETLYPYLLLIAGENNIPDPFDPRVVEAYWLGNNLLAAARFRPYANVLVDDLHLGKKLSRSKLSQTLSVLDSAFPQHCFHVLTIFRRTGHASLPHTIETMDNCRIGWGTIVNAKFQMPNVKSNQKNNQKYTYEIQKQTLVVRENKLALSEPIFDTATGLHDEYTPGDRVSLHWGYICDKLTKRQLANLEKFTQLALALANREQVLV